MIDIVIVNWNTGSLLRDCVESVFKYGKNQFKKLIIVDNGSTDDSLKFLDEFPNVKVIRVGKNIGFAAACNLGAKYGHSSYILFLNPDTRIETASLSKPLAFMEQLQNQNIAICGIQLFNEEGSVSQTCSHFPSISRLLVSMLGLVKLPMLKSYGVLMNDWDHRESRSVDQVIGAFFLIRRDIFQIVDGFDERFFVYFEEVDLSLRVKKAGYESWYFAEAKAFHAGNGSTSKVKALRHFYSTRSRVLYGFKNLSKWHAWLLFIATAFIEPPIRIAWCIVSGDIIGVKNTLTAYGMLLKDMSKILKDGIK